MERLNNSVLRMADASRLLTGSEAGIQVGCGFDREALDTHLLVSG